MSLMSKSAAMVVLIAAMAACGPVRPTQERMLIDLENGQIVVALHPDKAPRTIAHLRELARHHFYDGLSIVRVAPGHVVQGGDPNFDGTGGSGQPVALEASDLRHVRGAVGIARGADENSGDSQFYICLADRPQLDGKYTVIGYVVSGMDLVDAMKPGDGEKGFIKNQASQPKIIRLRISP